MSSCAPVYEWKSQAGGGLTGGWPVRGPRGCRGPSGPTAPKNETHMGWIAAHSPPPGLPTVPAAVDTKTSTSGRGPQEGAATRLHQWNHLQTTSWIRPSPPTILFRGGFNLHVTNPDRREKEVPMVPRPSVPAMNPTESHITPDGGCTKALLKSWTNTCTHFNVPHMHPVGSLHHLPAV